MEIKFKRNFKLVDNGDLTQNLHSLCYQNNRLIGETDLGNVEDILYELKKQQEIINRTLAHLDIFISDEQLSKYDTLKILMYAKKILEDKEV